MFKIEIQSFEIICIQKYNLFILYLYILAGSYYQWDISLDGTHYIHNLIQGRLWSVETPLA